MKKKRWSKMLALVLVLVMTVNMGAAAAGTKGAQLRKGSAFTKNGLVYQVTSLKGKKGTVKVAGVAKKNVKSVNIPQSVKSGGIALTVDEIGNNAFRNCKNLQKVTTGKALKVIGNNAFLGCAKLKNLNISASTKLESIGKNALKGAPKVKVEVPKTKNAAYVEKKLGIANVKSAETEQKAQVQSQVNVEASKKAAAETKKAETVVPTGKEEHPTAETVKKVQAQTEAKTQVKAAGTEAKAKAAETEAKVKAAETEAKARAKTAETEAKTKAAETEAKVKVQTAETEEQKKSAAQEEALKKAAAEAEALKKAAAEAEAQKKAAAEAEEALKRAAEEEEAKKKAAEAEEALKKAAEEEEAKKKAAEAEEALKKAAEEAEAKARICSKGNHVFLEDWKVTKEPTCAEWGTKARHCVCGKSVQSTLSGAPTGQHVYEHEETVAPTCEKAGESCDICSVCGQRINVETIPAKGHNYVKYTKGGCVGTVISYEECSECQKRKENATYEPAPGHDWKVTETGEATCTSNAYVVRTCNRCGETEKVEDYYSKAAHDLSEVVETVSATCTADGYVVKKCAKCGYTKTEITEKALGHSFGVPVIVQPSTCEQRGRKESSCTRCGLTSSQEIPCSGHRWVLNENRIGLSHCADCGVKFPDPSN